MKKVNISMYVPDNYNMESFVTDSILSASMSCEDLISVKETPIETANQGSYILLFYYTSFRKNCVFELERMTECKEEKIKSLLHNRYLSKKSGDKLKLDFYLKDDNRGIILDMDDENTINYLRDNMTPNLFTNKVAKLDIVKINGKYFGFTSEKVDGSLLLELADQYPVGVIERFMDGNIYSNEDFENTPELFDATFNKIKDTINKCIENSDEKALTSIVNVLISRSSNVYASKENRSIGSSTIKMPEAKFLELLELTLDALPRKKAIQSVTKTVHKERITVDGPRCGYNYDLAKIILKKYDLLTDEEINNLNNESDDFLSKFKKELALTAISAFYYLNEVVTAQSTSWNLNLVDTIMITLGRRLGAIENLDEEFKKLSEQEKDELFNSIKVVLERYLIVKEITSYSYYLSNCIRYLKNEEFRERFVKLLLEILENYKGHESMTIRSIINKGGMHINGIDVFKYVNVMEHPKISKLVFEYKLK